MQIVPAAAWGCRTWATAVPTVPPGDRTHFVVHHDGEHQVLREGASIPRAIDAAHRAQGWVGIGYNFVVSQDGQIWEGRGWDRVGAHCPGRNRDGIGVQVAVGGGQVPTAAALHAVRWLYDEACRRAGRELTRTWHGAHYATDCPGLALVAWVRQGMPDPTPPPPDPQEHPLASLAPDERAALIRDIATATADAITSIRARHPVTVAAGTGASQLPGGRYIDAIPTVIGEIQDEQRTQSAKLAALAEGLETLIDVVRGLAATRPTT